MLIGGSCSSGWEFPGGGIGGRPFYRHLSPSATMKDMPRWASTISLPLESLKRNSTFLSPVIKHPTVFSPGKCDGRGVGIVW